MFFFNDTATTEIYTLSLHDALPISVRMAIGTSQRKENTAGNEIPGRSHMEETSDRTRDHAACRSEEHTSELQSQFHLVCRLLLEKKKKIYYIIWTILRLTNTFCDHT